MAKDSILEHKIYFRSISDYTNSKLGVGGVSWVYWKTAEMGMGGPGYGDLIFSTGYAFEECRDSGFYLSTDGRHAVILTVSGDMFIVDMLDARCYELCEGTAELWSTEYLKSPQHQGSEELHVLNFKEVVKRCEEIPMVEDHGWHLIDKPRSPFPDYAGITLASSCGTHVLRLVPDLGDAQVNPFRFQHLPEYEAFVDDIPTGLRVKLPQAVWIDGIAADGAVIEGRFLAINEFVLDFVTTGRGVFDVTGLDRHILKVEDPSTQFTRTDLQSAGPGALRWTVAAMPRDNSGSAETPYFQHAFVYDDDEEEDDDDDDAEAVRYVDAAGGQSEQLRKNPARHLQYHINLDALFKSKDLLRSSRIEIASKAQPGRAAYLEFTGMASDDAGAWGCYRCSTTCGVVLERVAQECVWSACGRYLALVEFAPDPKLPTRLCIVDFDTASVRALPGVYALPSFIWFDSVMLDFTHIAGIRESISRLVPPPYKSEEKIYRTGDPGTGSPYELLLGDLAQRKNIFARKNGVKSDSLHIETSIDHLSQHCALFAPNFDTAILQGSSQ